MVFLNVFGYLSKNSRRIAGSFLAIRPKFLVYISDHYIKTVANMTKNLIKFFSPFI